METIKKYETVLKELKAGNKRFLDGKSAQSPASSLKKLKDFAKSGQTPKAVILCCSDSRAPVEIIFDQDIGDLFVIRVAGNIVAPSLVGSVEFAASTFGTDLVLVMGHTQCGAIAATLNHIQNSEMHPSENIHGIVSRIKPHVYPIAIMSQITQEEKVARSVEANVIASVGQLLSSSRLIEDLVSKDKLKVVGAVLDLSTGAVSFLKD